MENEIKMEVENIIKYLLIGNLISGKIIYEMINTNNAKIIFDINQLFNSFYKNNNEIPERARVDSYNIMVILQRIIMISKTHDAFPLEQNFELLKAIKSGLPYLDQMPINWNFSANKSDIEYKIPKIIKEFFQNLENNNQINANTFRKNIGKSKSSKIYENKNNNNDKKIINHKNSLISTSDNRSFDNDKNSVNQLIQDKSMNKSNNGKKINQKKNNNKYVIVKILDNNKFPEKNNISKSLTQSSIILKNNNNLQSSEMSKGMAKELEGIILRITCCKKVIFFILLLIIIAQIIIIPFIIKYSYSY